MKKVSMIQVGVSLILALLILLDQLTKRWALLLDQPWDIGDLLGCHLAIAPTTNTGSAWSIGQGWGPWFMYARIVFGILVAIVWYVHILRLLRHRPPTAVIPYIFTTDLVNNIPIAILVMAGTVGNTIDRIVHAHVIDFIAVDIGTWCFPIFNLADSWITAGIIWHIVCLLLAAGRADHD